MATRPRAYFKGSTHHLVSRTILRKFLTRPESWVTQNFLYLLGLLAPKYGILIHAFFLSTNHYHLLVTDTLGDQIPHFMRELNSLFARSVNAQRSRTGYFWEGRYRACEIAPHLEELTDTLAYISTNGVKDGLVPYSTRWSGASLLPQGCGSSLSIQRPAMAFYEATQLPEEVTVETCLPEPLEAVPDTELQQSWVEAHDREERKVRKTFKRKGRKFLGMKRILRQSWDAAPASWVQLWEIIPSIVCRDIKERVEWFLWRRRREREYRAALFAFRDGARDTVFPIGTWFKHIMDGACRALCTESYWEAYARSP